MRDLVELLGKANCGKAACAWTATCVYSYSPGRISTADRCCSTAAKCGAVRNPRRSTARIDMSADCKVTSQDKTLDGQLRCGYWAAELCGSGDVQISLHVQVSLDPCVAR